MNRADWHAHRHPFLPPEIPPREPLSSLAIGTAALLLWAIALLWLLPVAK